MLEHGGQVRAAARAYGIEPAGWLDLSTGINPCGYPLPAVPAEAWARLPQSDDALLARAADYYGSHSLLAVAGSQAAIQALPRLRACARVAIVGPSYSEHAHAWRRAGHEVRELSADRIDSSLQDFDVVVAVNPNNPTGELLTRERLLSWLQPLDARGGWLVLDEAFADCDASQSLAGHCPRPGLWVLRSLGKFFGLAGARVGFALAQPELLQALSEELGPWPIAGPSRWAAQQALADREWQKDTRERLPRAAQRLAKLLDEHGLTPSGSNALFQYVCTPHAARIREALARQAIWVRVFTDIPALRIGLPGDEEQWQRLGQALKHPDMQP